MKKIKNSNGYMQKLRIDFKRNWYLYLMILPVLLYYALFHYKPMYGALMAFQDFVPRKGISGSEWVGFKHFINLFKNPYFFQLLRNTLTISVANLVFGFPAPILLALLLNELKLKRFGKVVQTLCYLPHFISLVVICSMVRQFCASSGIINDFLAFLNLERVDILARPDLFVPVHVLSGIWSTMGFNSIVYLSALMAVDQELYDAARVDGAGRFRQVLNVTIPCIMPTVVIMLILRIGQLMSVGYEKIILLYNPLTYETADVLSSFVYRRGLIEGSYSYSAAAGLFNSVINCTLVIVANKISQKVSDTSLW